MAISRLPHPVFSAFWAARYVAMIAAGLWGSDAVLFWAWALFVPAEGLGLMMDTGRRDQLSEIWTWVLRALAKPEYEESVLGWNLLAFIFAGIEAGVTHWALATFLPTPYPIGIALALWALLFVHWVWPQRFG